MGAKLLGHGVAVSPVVTVEPRRRKFHKAITLSMPAPRAHSQGMINQYSGSAPTLRLLCSITGKASLLSIINLIIIVITVVVEVLCTALLKQLLTFPISLIFALYVNTLEGIMLKSFGCSLLMFSILVILTVNYENTLFLITFTIGCTQIKINSIFN